MNLHEYQAKFRFAEFGIPIPKGKVARTPEDAVKNAEEIGLPVVVKAQVHIGGRGKAGGVKLASTLDEVRTHAENILGMDIRGHIVDDVLIDPATDIQQEIYLAITTDRGAGKPLIMASAEGGMDIEELAATSPEKIARVHVDPIMGLHTYQANTIASKINIPREQWRDFVKVVGSLYRCFVASDAELAEINPLVITGGGKVMALDGKMSIDDNALARQPELAKLRDTSDEPEAETKARNAGISYVKLDGQIGCMVNGAGLAMTTMDMTKLYGGDAVGPANFLDIGGGASAETVATALEIILSDPHVKVVLFNIFGGITRCDDVARGVIGALDRVHTDIPMVIRLQGTNAKEGRAIINEANLPNMTTAATLTEAAQKAVEIAKGEV